MPVDLDEITENEHSSLFKLEYKNSKTYEQANENLQMEIIIELNRDLQVIERTSYNIFDILSDVGGIGAALQLGL